MCEWIYELKDLNSIITSNNYLEIRIVAFCRLVAMAKSYIYGRKPGALSLKSLAEFNSWLYSVKDHYLVWWCQVILILKLPWPPVWKYVMLLSGQVDNGHRSVKTVYSLKSYLSHLSSLLWQGPALLLRYPHQGNQDLASPHLLKLSFLPYI